MAGLAGNQSSVTYPLTKFTSRAVTFELTPESGKKARIVISKFWRYILGPRSP